MSDERLRELERRFRESGSPQDGEAYYNELVRIGRFPAVHIEPLAALGDEAAQCAYGVEGSSSLEGAVAILSSLHLDAVIRAGIALAHACLESQFGNASMFFQTDHYAQAYFAIEKWFVTRALGDANRASQAAGASLHEESLVLEEADTSRAVDFVEAAEIRLGLDVIGTIAYLPQRDLHNTIQLVTREADRIQGHLAENDQPDSEQVVRNWILTDLRPWLMGETDPIADRVRARS